MNTDQKSLEMVFSIAISRQLVSNDKQKLYFLVSFVNSIDVFDCCRCGFFVYFMILQWTFYLELLVLERKIYNNDDITFFSEY